MTPAQDLPPADGRWTAGRKAQIVDAVLSGSITLTDACCRYSMSSEEFESWTRSLARHGQSGLRQTRLQAYQPTRLRRPRLR